MANEEARSSILNSDHRRGFTLLELMITTVIVALLASLVVPRVQAVRIKAHVASVAGDANILYKGLQEFYALNYGYPNATSNPKFDLTTFEPLRSQVNYQGDMLDRLKDGQADSYDSPDDQGPNQEFWVQMTLMIDESYQVVLASSDNAPLGGGMWLEGVFVFKDGVLVQGPGV